MLAFGFTLLTSLAALSFGALLPTAALLTLLPTFAALSLSTLSAFSCPLPQRVDAARELPRAFERIGLRIRPRAAERRLCFAKFVLQRLKVRRDLPLEIVGIRLRHP